MVSITGFTVASMLCGMAQSLPQIVLFRVLQGAFGAALVPLSQSVLFAIYPKERQGFAMALFGHRRDDRPGARSGARRLAHLELQLALGLLYQSADRHSRSLRHHVLPARIAAARGYQARLVRLRHAERHARRAANHARSRRAEGLVQLRRDRHRSDRCGVGVLSVHRPYVYRGKAIRAAGAVPRPQFFGRRCCSSSSSV